MSSSSAVAPWVMEAISQYGHHLGVPALQIGTHGVATLELQDGGLLAIEPGRGRAAELLVSLARPLGFDAAPSIRKALAMAHHSAAVPVAVQVGVRGEGTEALLIALVRVPQREFNLQRLEQTVEQLMRWSEGVMHV